jgi:hypothetical protein
MWSFIVKAVLSTTRDNDEEKVPHHRAAGRF